MGDPVDREQLGGVPVAEGDGAGLVEEQDVDVTGRLDRTAGHGQHVAADQPVHAGDADGREQRADRGRDQADQQRDQHQHRLAGAAVVGDRPQRRADDDEDDGQRGEQHVEGDLVGGALALRALDQGDHPVHEGLAGVAGDPDDDPVGEHRRAAGDRAAVAAGLADHRAPTRR